MKIAWMAIAAAALLWTPSVQAQALKLSKITCEEFIKSDKDVIGSLMMWLGGFYMGNNDDAVIDFDKLAKQGKKLGKFCAENPAAKLSKAAEKIMGE
ncbi:MAG TPA: HdeA/HdeB family chaperone [Stellaceae bacterium]